MYEYPAQSGVLNILKNDLIFFYIYQINFLKMIRHIVMFRLKKFADKTQKANAARTVIEHLDQLPIRINEIRKYEAGIDLRELKTSYDVVLEMDFDSMADLEAYTIHPAHQEFIAFNKQYSAEIACIDFETGL